MWSTTCKYGSILGKHLLPGKCPCTEFQGVDVAASTQTISQESAHEGQNCELYMFMELIRDATNRMGMERKYIGGVQIIERQMVELAFRFDGTEWNRNVNIFMPPTVYV